MGQVHQLLATLTQQLLDFIAAVTERGWLGRAQGWVTTNGNGQSGYVRFPVEVGHALGDLVDSRAREVGPSVKRELPGHVVVRAAIGGGALPIGGCHRMRCPVNGYADLGNRSTGR